MRTLKKYNVTYVLAYVYTKTAFPTNQPTKQTGLRDDVGDSLLHAAVAAGNVDVVLVLLLHGMDTQTLNKDKHTALHVACGNCSEQMDSAAIVFTLLKYVYYS